LKRTTISAARGSRIIRCSIRPAAWIGSGRVCPRRSHALSWHECQDGGRDESIVQDDRRLTQCAHRLQRQQFRIAGADTHEQHTTGLRWSSNAPHVRRAVPCFRDVRWTGALCRCESTLRTTMNVQRLVTARHTPTDVRRHLDSRDCDAAGATGTRTGV
jgi:hypothetical protein